MKRCLNCMEEYEEQNTACPCCGWDGSWKKREQMEPGSILQGRYIIGTVRNINPADMLYIGWDALFARKVLVEEYFPQSRVYRNEKGELETFQKEDKEQKAGLARFVEDGQKLIMLDDTRGLVNVLGMVAENRTAYMIMEYPGEKTLRQEFLENAPRTLEQAKRLLMDISWPLLAAHRWGLYHGQLCMECCYALGQDGYKIGWFNEAGYITGDVADESAGPPGPGADIFELAHIIGAALCGVDKWENGCVDDNLDWMAGSVPSYIIDALSEALSDESSRRQESLRRFLDEFLDEATIEMPSNRVLPEEELPRKPLPLWKKIFFDNKGGIQL